MIDFRKIENELRISLPAHYVSFMQQFEGFGIDMEDEDQPLKDVIYTDADYLIDKNRKALPIIPEALAKQKLLIGISPWGNGYLIDLQNTMDERVYCYDVDEFQETGTMDFYENLASFKEEMESLFSADN